MVNLLRALSSLGTERLWVWEMCEMRAPTPLAVGALRHSGTPNRKLRRLEQRLSPCPLNELSISNRFKTAFFSPIQPRRVAYPAATEHWTAFPAPFSDRTRPFAGGRLRISSSVFLPGSVFAVAFLRVSVTLWLFLAGEGNCRIGLTSPFSIFRFPFSGPANTMSLPKMEASSICN
jgi:hypothetical protein